jgi:uncharacterized protein YbjT (DUF2867 family)
VSHRPQGVTVLLIGATGFLGAAIHAALLTEGYRVVATYHRGPKPSWPHMGTDWRQADLGRLDEGCWERLLAGSDAVINCAGVLQDNAWDSTARVHALGLPALIAACEKARVRRFIHFSAIGADRHDPTAFSRTKRAGEALLRASFLDWVILRPSVVVGRGAFGGSALFRGLAALPLLPVMPDTGLLQIVQRDDVVRTVLSLLKPDAPARLALDLAGPERLSFAQVVALYRGWLGRRPARQWMVPAWLARQSYRLGDLVRALGWRPPLSSTARQEMVYGAVGDAGPWTSATGIVPIRLEDALASEPASVQERWFARLYLLKAVGFTIFSLFWIATGIISLTGGYPIGLALMREGGAGPLAGPSVVAGALADLTVGTLIAFRPTTRYGLYGAIALTLFYVVAGSVLLPRLWLEPLGPLLKIWPILALNLFLLAILEER